MNIRRRYVLIGVIVLVLGLLLYLIFSNSIRGGNNPDAQKFTLNVWGVEDEGVFSSIAGGYQAVRPGATITYKRLDPRTYKETILNALAGGTGPDVFYIKNHDIPAEKEKLSPANLNEISRVLGSLYDPKQVEGLTFILGHDGKEGNWGGK